MSDDFEQRMDEESRREREAIRALCLENGRPDLAADYDKNMRNLDLGITTAQNCWHSISGAQRRVLIALGEGRVLKKCRWSRSRYDACGIGYAADAIENICAVATVRNLASRELLAWEGGAFEPEAKVVLTERGRFVLKHGAQHSCPTCRK